MAWNQVLATAIAPDPGFFSDFCIYREAALDFSVFAYLRINCDCRNRHPVAFALDLAIAYRLKARSPMYLLLGTDMSGMNFFSWLRDGVRQSVLLGVNDAVEQLGAPASDGQLNPALAGILQLHGNDREVKKISGTTNASSGRKRLGKSLKDIGADPGQ